MNTVSSIFGSVLILAALIEAMRYAVQCYNEGRAKAKRIIIPLSIVDYGVLGIRVYVDCEHMQKRISLLTNAKTLTRRHVLALHSLGYHFGLANTTACDVPTWLSTYLCNAEVIGTEAA